MATLKNTVINDTGYFQVPYGTTAQRPSSPVQGMMRFNTTLLQLEVYSSANLGWVRLGASVPLNGLVGWYTADNWTGTSWTDISGANNNATTYRGTITQESHNGTSFGASATFTTLSGDLGAGIQFPSAILPSTYTLFHVTRYNLAIGTGGGDAAGRGRIFDGVASNWLSGFWNGGSGRTYHDGWMTDYNTDYHGNYWVISTDQVNYYRSRSKNSNSGNPYEFSSGGTSSKQLSINYGYYTGGTTSGERSYWRVAEVIVYNRALPSYEIVQIETYLRLKYGI